VGVASLLSVAALACGSANTANYVQAAAALAYNVPMAVVHKEVTGGCYSNCSYGSECNPATGLCVPIKERQPTSTLSTAPTLEERCTWAERDWAENSARLGDKHPDMQALRRMLEKCVELRGDPDSARVTACGTLELDLASLEGKGLGRQHPEVIAAQGGLKQCIDASKPRPSPSIGQQLLTPTSPGTLPH